MILTVCSSGLVPDYGRTKLEEALLRWAEDFYSEDESPAGEKISELLDVIYEALRR